MKFQETRIKDVSRALTGRDRGRYFYTGTTPPRRLTGRPGTPSFVRSLARHTALSAYKEDEPVYKTDHDVWASLALRRMRSRSQERGTECDIEHDDLLNLLDKQGFRCALTGSEFVFDNDTASPRRAFLPSVDRIDNSIGYTASNIRLTTVIANIARSDFGDEAFLQMCADSALNNRLLTIAIRS